MLCVRSAKINNRSAYAPRARKQERRHFSSNNQKTKKEYAGQHRTGITAQLWKERLQMESSSATSAPTPVPKSPKSSAVEVKLNFSTDEQLRDSYLSPYGHLRFGKLLEDFDAIAAHAAWRHADDGNANTRALTIVTASVDRIELHKRLLPDEDITITGNVTHVGKTSLEVVVEALKMNARHNPVIRASFSLVAKSPDPNARWTVNPLIPSTPEEKERFAQGERNKALRLQRKEQSLCNKPPTEDERLVIHELFMETSKKSDPNWVPMSKTQNSTLILCQPSERNPNNTMFGGWLMKAGFELAFSTSYLFARSQPYFVAMDDVTFHRPVHIGSLLRLTSQVVFTQDKHIQVEVVATVTDPEVGSSLLTNTFYFTFHCPKYTQQQVKRVYPETYAEAIKYLEGRRRHLTRPPPSIDLSDSLSQSS